MRYGQECVEYVGMLHIVCAWCQVRWMRRVVVVKWLGEGWC